MARKKKALERFVNALPGSSLPSEGCKQYRLAMSNLRMFVAENCPYGTKIEVCSHGGFEVSLSTPVTYRSVSGILLEGAEVHTSIDPDGSVKDLMREIGIHARKIETLLSHSRMHTNNLQQNAF